MELHLPLWQIICPGRSWSWVFGLAAWLIPQRTPEKASWRKVCWQCRTSQQPGRGWRMIKGAHPHLTSHQEIQRSKWCEIPAIPVAHVEMPQCPRTPLMGTRVNRKPRSWCVFPQWDFPFWILACSSQTVPFPEAPAARIYFICAVSFISSFPGSATSLLFFL